MKKTHLLTVILFVVLALCLVGCSSPVEETDESTSIQTTETENDLNITSVGGTTLDTSEMFTDRDLEQSADLTEAQYIELSSGEDIVITEEGVYVLSGDVEDVTVIVDADDEAKVQLVLDDASIVNEDMPTIYVVSADKVFVTTTDSDNSLEVTGTYQADRDTNLDAVIFSKDDLVMNGLGTLEVISTEGNGITSKDDLKITGGVYTIASYADGLEANDSIRIYDGDITIVSYADALHSENEDDASLGYIYIHDGTLNIYAVDDAIRGTTIIQIDGGLINVESCTEGLEATSIQINGGEISIYATDDGINATAKSNYFDVKIEVNGGTIDVVVASGDTDAFDSNGDLYINGGTINVEAPTSSFDVDGTAELNDGEVTVNGQIIAQITPSQMGGGMPGDMPGGRPR